MKVITCAIHKGGVGKTTTCVHLVHYLARIKYRVLAVDCDAQGNFSMAFSDTHSEDAGASRLYHKPMDAPDIETFNENISVIPADQALDDVGRLDEDAELHFRENLKSLAAEFDYVVIDTPPSLGPQTLVPLVASDYVFSPLAPEIYGVTGVSKLYDRVVAIRDNYNESMQYLGLVINRWNRKNHRHNEAVEAIQENMPELVMPHAIGERSAIANVAYTRSPVWEVNTGAARLAAEEMLAAMDWIVQKTEERK